MLTWCSLTILFFSVLQVTFTINAEVRTTVVLECNLNSTFPEWIGPNNTALTALNDTQRVVTAEGMEYVNDTHLQINSVAIAHEGDYICGNSTENQTVELMVFCKLSWTVNCVLVHAKYQNSSQRFDEMSSSPRMCSVAKGRTLRKSLAKYIQIYTKYKGNYHSRHKLKSISDAFLIYHIVSMTSQPAFLLYLFFFISVEPKLQYLNIDLSWLAFKRFIKHLLALINGFHFWKIEINQTCCEEGI